MNAAKTEYGKIDPYITKDGSIIRELMHPAIHGNSGQSLAEATVPAGDKQCSTNMQWLRKSITSRKAVIMTSAGRSLKSVKEIPSVFYPNSAQDNEHREKELKILCCCAPAYSHEDTELMK